MNCITRTQWPFLAVFFFITAWGADTEAQYYYARLDVVSENNCIVDTHLMMIPAENEFRVDRIQTIKITGQAAIKDTDDLKKTARQSAIINLLISYGLKSVDGHANLVNGTATDKVRLRYEGVIQPPLAIDSEGYDKARGLYLMNMRINFSAIAFPTQWHWLYLKKCFSDMLTDLVIFFKGPPALNSFP